MVGKKRGQSKEARQEMIRNVIQSKSLRTQEEVKQELSIRNLDVSQVTISRDFEEMGVEKDSSAFFTLDKRKKEEYLLKQFISQHAEKFIQDPFLVAIRTEPGFGAAIAKKIQDFDETGLVGSVVGNEMVILAYETQESKNLMLQLFDTLNDDANETNNID